MTREEAIEFLANTKVYVNGKSKEIQEKLFSLGYEWFGGGTDVCYTKSPFLYMSSSMTLTMGNDMEHFSERILREISAEEILSLELTEPTYRPFKDADECWNEMLKHEPFGWTKHKKKQFYFNWLYVDSDGVDQKKFNDVYKDFTFADGTPFGIKED